jgi:hypothetical protein
VDFNVTSQVANAWFTESFEIACMMKQNNMYFSSSLGRENVLFSLVS